LPTENNLTSSEEPGRCMGARKDIRYTFGRNWQSFVDHCLSQEHVQLAEQSLRNVLGMENFNGCTFLDVGCGSGLYSLAAALMGAQRVTSFDYDTQPIDSHASQLRKEPRADH